MRQCFKMFNLAPHFMFCNYVLEFMLIIKLHERWKQESLCKTHTFSARLTVKLFFFHGSKNNPAVCWGRGFGKDGCCVTTWYLPALARFRTNNMNHTSMALSASSVRHVALHMFIQCGPRVPSLVRTHPAFSTGTG